MAPVRVTTSLMLLAVLAAAAVTHGAASEVSVRSSGAFQVEMAKKRMAKGSKDETCTWGAVCACMQRWKALVEVDPRMLWAIDELQMAAEKEATAKSLWNLMETELKKLAKDARATTLWTLQTTRKLALAMTSDNATDLAKQIMATPTTTTTTTPMVICRNATNATASDASFNFSNGTVCESCTSKFNETTGNTTQVCTPLNGTNASSFLLQRRSHTHHRNRHATHSRAAKHTHRSRAGAGFNAGTTAGEAQVAPPDVAKLLLEARKKADLVELKVKSLWVTADNAMRKISSAGRTKQHQLVEIARRMAVTVASMKTVGKTGYLAKIQAALKAVKLYPKKMDLIQKERSQAPSAYQFGKGVKKSEVTAQLKVLAEREPMVLWELAVEKKVRAITTIEKLWMTVRDMFTEIADELMSQVSDTKLSVAVVSKGYADLMTNSNYSAAASLLQEGAHFAHDEDLAADMDPVKVRARYEKRKVLAKQRAKGVLMVTKWALGKIGTSLAVQSNSTKAALKRIQVAVGPETVQATKDRTAIWKVHTTTTTTTYGLPTCPANVTIQMNWTNCTIINGTNGTNVTSAALVSLPAEELYSSIESIQESITPW